MLIYTLLLTVTLAACKSSVYIYVEVGGDVLITSPETALLESRVRVGGAPANATTNITWTQLRGDGVAMFAKPNAESTDVSFSAPGDYVLEVTATVGDSAAQSEVAVTVLAAGTAPVSRLAQVAYAATGYDENGQFRSLPSIDPAGLVYDPDRGHLIVVDSEINETPVVFTEVGANVFETSLSVDAFVKAWDTTVLTLGKKPDAKTNEEPTGIAYCTKDKHFYVTNDDRDAIYRYALDGAVLRLDDVYSVRDYTDDPEGITCDPVTGRLYVIGGHVKNVTVLRYDEGFVFEKLFFLDQTAGDDLGIPKDPEGIAFDPLNRHLFVVSSSDKAVFEYNLIGQFIARYDISDLMPRPKTPQGLTVGPSSRNSATMSLYIADGGKDNDSNPDQRDGAIYEAAIIRADFSSP